MGLLDPRLGRILGMGPSRNRFTITMDLFSDVIASSNTTW